MEWSKQLEICRRVGAIKAYVGDHFKIDSGTFWYTPVFRQQINPPTLFLGVNIHLEFKGIEVNTFVFSTDLPETTRCGDLIVNRIKHKTGVNYDQ